MATVKTPITELDFDGIKSQLKTYLQTQTQFKDYNFEGSNLSALLDVLAFNTFNNNFYTNMAINEMFLDTAMLKNSIVSHAKELNYLPRSRKSARAQVIITISNEAETAQTITIPQYSNISATYLGDTFNFVTDQAFIAKRIAVGVYQTDTITIYEGQMLESFQREGFIVDSEGVLRVALSNDNVDTDSLVVFVDAEATDNQNVFTLARDIYGVEPTDKVFFIEPYFDDRFSVYFGNNNFGQQPEEFEDVRVRYRITSGAEGNGITNFTASFVEGASITVETVVASLGGAEREGIESIRFNAPRALQIQERAITTKDYEILLKQKFPEITSASVYGGDELDPPQYGKVAISVYLSDDTTIISQTLANSYIEYLNDRSPLSIEPVFVQTEYVYADTTIDISYTSKLASRTASELESLVRAAVQTYSDDTLEDFDKTLRISKLSTALDAIDTSIQSTSIDVKPIIEYAPALNIKANPRFQFGQKLIQPYAFNIGSDSFTGYKPAIKSSPFDLNNVCVFIQDDGVGNIQIVSEDTLNQQVIKPIAGTVDYETGEVKLVDFVVQKFSGSGIKITANTVDQDVKSPKGRVFIIRDTDVVVNMNLIESKSATINTSKNYT